MSYDHLYRPEPCAAWPVAELGAVGTAYRDAGGCGLDGPACLEVAVGAYLAAGGGQHGTEDCRGLGASRLARFKHGRRGAEAREAARLRGKARQFLASMRALLASAEP